MLELEARTATLTAQGERAALPDPERHAPHALAAAYLKGIPLEERRQAGQVYTPLHLVRFVLERAGYGPDLPVEGASLLDPACGGGIFLETAAMLLAARLESLGVDFATPEGHAELLGRVAANLHGVDVDATACELTRRAVRAAVQRVSPGPVPVGYFDGNVLHADYLLSAEPERSAPLGGFDFVVGNPPYVTTSRLEGALKGELRARFATASGRLDLYTLFIERSLPLLAPGGRLAFVTPDKFLTSLSSGPLRRLMLWHGAVRALARFRSHQVFEGAATVPCVTVFERGAAQGEVAVLECGERPDEAGNVPVLRRFVLPASRLRGPEWRLDAPDLGRLAERVQGRHRTLESVTRRISAGVATGANDVFVFPAGSVDVEPELLRGTVRARDLAPFRVTDPGLHLLVPYVYGEDGRRRLVRLEDYPRARAHLEPHRERLEARQVVQVKGQPWHAYTDPPSSDLSRLEKLLVPDVAEHNRFAFDGGGLFPLNNAYYLVPEGVDPHYLTAVLNSTPVEFLVRLRAPLAKDGFSRYRQQFLAPLPVPTADEATTRAISEAARAGDRVACDALCTALFGLTSAELDGINAFLGREV